MGRSPFAAKESSSKSASRQRRSTRIDFTTPVILTGRDASGQSFREETETSIVNLHGAKVRTNYAIMVGMIVTLEIVRTGQGGKAVCVHVYEPSMDETAHSIAVQLVQPGNIWGVENPPPDWETVESELGGRHFAAKTPDLKATVMTVKPLLDVPASPTPAASRGDADAMFADLEKRSARLMESVLDILRIQADGAVRSSLQEVEKQVENMVTAGGVRLQERADQVGVELEMTLEAFRTEAMGEVVREALQGFQERLDALSTEAELRMTRRAQQVETDFEAGLKDFQKRLETLQADGDARIKRSSEEALTEYEAKLQTVQQRQGTQAAEAEAKISRLADQAIAKLEASRQNLQQLQEKMTADGDARIKRSNEAAVAEFEARLQTAQQRQGAKAEEAEAKISNLVDEAIAKLDASRMDLQQLQEKMAADGDARIKRSSEAALTEFEAKLQTALQRQGTQTADAEAKISRVAEQAMADFESALQTFRADVGDELAARCEEVVKSTEVTLRTRLAALLSTIITPPAVEPTSSPAGSKTKK